MTYVVVIGADLATELRGNLVATEFLGDDGVTMLDGELGRFDVGFRFSERLIERPSYVLGTVLSKAEKPWYAKFDKRPRK